MTKNLSLFVVGLACGLSLLVMFNDEAEVYAGATSGTPSCPAGSCPGDLDGNCMVDQSDLGILLAAFGTSCKSAECKSATDCDDGDPCTTDSCEDGDCVNTPINCDDGNACTIDMCVDGTCMHIPVRDGTACPDGGVCVAGTCFQS